ncbi:MAG: Rne/Rng family ribonuclease [Planctomycetota bacterium]|jgi:ribonuclease E|nr:Rne/Rng family ribonuclease [Planctomycetota bacterium]RLS65885.1 MAG: Rne/Rng family ribonuclease [Planctomycetota bacterium]RLS98309.1 MAG: Rne/Rng family ribonuclease [Planctomycetota bacterium]
MKKEMLINVSQAEECRIALLEDGILEELYTERTSQNNWVGNIYKGKIVNIEPSIQAAFVDFGVGRNGFLHISDIEPEYFRQAGYDPADILSGKNFGIDDEEGGGDQDPPQRSRGPNPRGGKLRSGRPRFKPPIQEIFKRGDEVVVQVIKEGIGTKGPTLSTYVSIPGRYLVLMPSLGRVGISRKIEDEVERKKLKSTMHEINIPKGVGFIVRTAAQERNRKELYRDVAYLLRLWKVLAKRIKNQPGPCDVYEESDIMIRTIRDTFTEDIDSILIDSPDAFQRAKEFMELVMPKYADRIELYDSREPLFHRFKLEQEIARIHQRVVPLKGGGSIVIDPTEALVAIDVNSGNFRGGDENAEENAFHLNLAASKEIARQLRLRDLGGVIVNDFIDMRKESHRRKVEKSLSDAMKRDRARTKILRTSPFGLIEMTRQRIRPSFKRSVYEDCPCCRGRALVKTAESMAIEVTRILMLASQHQGVARINVRVNENVAAYLNNRKRRELIQLEESSGVAILILGSDSQFPEFLEIDCRDKDNGIVTVPFVLSQ